MCRLAGRWTLSSISRLASSPPTRSSTPSPTGSSDTSSSTSRPSSNLLSTPVRTELSELEVLVYPNRTGRSSLCALYQRVFNMGRARFLRIICANAIEFCNIIISFMGTMSGMLDRLSFRGQSTVSCRNAPAGHARSQGQPVIAKPHFNKWTKRTVVATIRTGRYTG
jgi:hypothetical protein